MVNNGESPFEKLTEDSKKAILETVDNSINEVVGYCRGKTLCDNHMRTIKRDNKYRISKGIDIPENLDTLRILNGDY